MTGVTTIVQVLPECDMCDRPADFDAKTNVGPWAFLCLAHYKEYGVGLGTGLGQRLVLASEDTE